MESPTNSVVELTQEELPPEQFVFDIALLLGKIFKCLSKKDLKNTRLVCTRWNTFALETLEKRGDLEISAKFVRENVDPYFYSFDEESDYEYENCRSLDYVVTENYKITKIEGGKEKIRTLQDLNQFLNQTKRSGFSFPITNYKFFGGSLYHRKLEAFFKENGIGIKKLTLDVGAEGCRQHRFVFRHWDLFEFDFMSKYKHAFPHKLKMLLLEWAPNIEYLLLNHFPSAWENPVNRKLCGKNTNQNEGSKSFRLFQVGTILPRLKFLEIPQNTPKWLAKELLQITPNLVQCNRF